jgi:hypothetical protein
MSRARDLADLLDANGDVKSGKLDNVSAFPTNWSATLSGNDMVFQYNSTSKLKVATDGSITAVDDVTAFGSV